MKKLLRDLFDEECVDLKIDKSLVKAIEQFHNSYVNTNADYNDFFGGMWLGVHTILFTEKNRKTWFNEVLGTDLDYITERIGLIYDNGSVPKSKQDPVYGLNQNFIVSTDAFNISVVWIVHKLYNANNIPRETRYRAMELALMILHYKYLTGVMQNSFRWNADAKLAAATVNQLSNKFGIQREGSIIALFSSIAKKILEPSGIHHQTIEKMDRNDLVVYMLNDTQTRVRSIAKTIYSVMMEVKKSGGMVQSVSPIMEYDGETILKDKVGSVSKYANYLLNVVTDENGFIKGDLVNLVCELLPKLQSKHLLQALKYISQEAKSNSRDIEEFLRQVLVHCLNYLNEHSNFIKHKHDLGLVVQLMKGTYTSSRSKDDLLSSVRSEAERISKIACKVTSEATVATIRTGILLYIVIRALSAQYFQ